MKFSANLPQCCVLQPHKLKKSANHGVNMCTSKWRLSSGVCLEARKLKLTINEVAQANHHHGMLPEQSRPAAMCAPAADMALGMLVPRPPSAPQAAMWPVLDTKTSDSIHLACTHISTKQQICVNKWSVHIFNHSCCASMSIRMLRLSLNNAACAICRLACTISSKCTYPCTPATTLCKASHCCPMSANEAGCTILHKLQYFCL